MLCSVVQADEQDIRYKNAETYYELKRLYEYNKNTPSAPAVEQLERWNDSRLPPKLTAEEFNGGIITWPEFFTISNMPEIVDIERAMAGKMGLWDKITVRRSVRPLESHLYRYRYLLTGNERIRYRRFLEGLEAHAFYIERKQ